MEVWHEEKCGDCSGKRPLAECPSDLWQTLAALERRAETAESDWQDAKSRLKAAAEAYGPCDWTDDSGDYEAQIEPYIYCANHGDEVELCKALNPRALTGGWTKTGTEKEEVDGFKEMDRRGRALTGEGSVRTSDSHRHYCSLCHGYHDSQLPFPAPSDTEEEPD